MTATLDGGQSVPCLELLRGGREVGDGNQDVVELQGG